MKFYIRIVDGQPAEHPATEENLLQAFDCIPEGFEPFEHVEDHHTVQETLMRQAQMKNLGIKYDYTKREDGVWTHDWYLE
jgi:hypothetical protein